MPSLHTVMVKVHREYARQNRAAKDMVEACKKATTVTDRLHDRFSSAQVANTDLSERLCQTEEKLKKAEDQMQNRDFVNITQVPDQQLRNHLRKIEKKIHEANEREGQKDGRPHEAR